MIQCCIMNQSLEGNFNLVPSSKKCNMYYHPSPVHDLLKSWATVKSHFFVNESKLKIPAEIKPPLKVGSAVMESSVIKIFQHWQGRRNPWGYLGLICHSKFCHFRNNQTDQMLFIYDWAPLNLFTFWRPWLVYKIVSTG